MNVRRLVVPFLYALCIGPAALACMESGAALWLTGGRFYPEADPSSPKEPVFTSFEALARIPGIDKITELYLEDNLIDRIPARAFWCCPKLRVLHITNSGVREIGNHAFDDLTELVELNLAHNKLERLPADFCAYSSHLAALSLYNNSLSVLPSGVFGLLPSLRSLDIGNNNLRRLPPDFLAMVQQLQFFACARNEFPVTDERIFCWDEKRNPTWLRAYPERWGLVEGADVVWRLSDCSRGEAAICCVGTEMAKMSASERELHLLVDAMAAGDCVVREWAYNVLVRKDLRGERVTQPLLRTFAPLDYFSRAHARDLGRLQQRLDRELFGALMAEPKAIGGAFGRPKAESDASSVTLSACASPEEERRKLVARLLEGVMDEEETEQPLDSIVSLEAQIVPGTFDPRDGG